MNKKVILLGFISICIYTIKGAESSLSSKKLDAHVTALVATILQEGISKTMNDTHPFASYHLTNADHWKHLERHPFEVGDIIITPLLLSNRVKYSVHGDGVKTGVNPLNFFEKISVIVHPGTVTFMSKYYHGHSLPQSEKKYRTVK